MARDLAFDFTTNDLIFKNGDMQLVENAKETEQRLPMHLKTQNGEMWTQPNEGVAYIKPKAGETRKILGALISEDDVLEILTEEGRRINEVTGFSKAELTQDPNTRNTKVDMSANTIFGEDAQAQVII